MYVLLDTFLLDSLKSTKNWFNSLDLFDIARDPLLLDLHFMLKLVPLEDLSLDLPSDVALGLAGLFTCEQCLSDTCLSHLEVSRVKCQLLFQCRDLVLQVGLLSLCISRVLADLSILHMESLLLLFVEFGELCWRTHVLCCLTLQQKRILGLLHSVQL
jgi:hypothetical protein